MFYSITCSTKLFTVVIAPLFVSVGIMREFAMVSDMYIYCPLRKKRCTFLPEGTDARYISGYTYLKEELNLLFVIIIL